MTELEFKIFRASDAPLALACPAAVNAPPEEIQIDSFNPAGIQGTAVHVVAEQIVRQNRLPDDWQQTCRRYGLEGPQIVEARFLVYAVLDFWKSWEHAFYHPTTEFSLWHSSQTFQLSGHVDVFSLNDDEVDKATAAIILDWKSTRLDIDYLYQMLFYAWLAILEFPSLETVKTCVVYLRDRTANIQEWSAEQIREFGQRFIREVVNWNGSTYRPGGHCSYCRRFANCQAHKALVVQTLDEIAPLESLGVNSLEPAALVSLHQRLSVLLKMADMVKDHIRARVGHSGGEIPDGQGKSLKIISSSRDIIDAEKSWPIISQILTTQELAAATTINKSKLLDAVADHALRGKKGEAKKEIMEQLRDAGAVTTREFSQLRVVNSTLKEIGLVTSAETI